MRTDLRIVETLLGPTLFIVGPETELRSGCRAALPVFGLYPFTGTASRREAVATLQRLQQLESASLLGADEYL